jgi:hypothetical protein
MRTEEGQRVDVLARHRGLLVDVGLAGGGRARRRVEPGDPLGARAGLCGQRCDEVTGIAQRQHVGAAVQRGVLARCGWRRSAWRCAAHACRSRAGSRRARRPAARSRPRAARCGAGGALQRVLAPQQAARHARQVDRHAEPAHRLGQRFGTPGAHQRLAADHQQRAFGARQRGSGLPAARPRRPEAPPAAGGAAICTAALPANMRAAWRFRYQRSARSASAVPLPAASGTSRGSRPRRTAGPPGIRGTPAPARPRAPGPRPRAPRWPTRATRRSL